MNKKFFIFSVAMVLVAALAGCMPTNQNGGGNPNAGNPQPSTSGGEQLPSSADAAKNPFGFGKKGGQDSNEVETTELKIAMADGQTETVTATIYKGNGYQIAVPEGRERDENEPEWSPRSSEGIEFSVRYYPGKKAKDVQDIFELDYHDYQFEDSAEGTLANIDKVTELRGSEVEEDGTDHLVAYLIETEKGCYGLLLECPKTATESFGGYLGAMANSFQLITEKKK